MHLHVRRFAMAVLLLAVAACAGNRARTASTADDEERTTVRVQNQTFSQATVYVVHLSQRIRLGDVGPSGDRRFTIPSDLVAGGRPLQFLVDPVGSTRVAPTYEIMVRVGDEVDLIIPPGTF
jgi:hypothetical protein